MQRPRPGRSVPAALMIALTLLALTALSPVHADERHWARVHHTASEVDRVVAGLSDTLMDYGAFQWGLLDTEQISLLSTQGLRLTLVDRPFHLTLGDEHFDPLDQAALDSLFGDYRPDPAGDFHLIQFSGPIRPEWLAELRNTGLQLVQPLHPFSYIVWASADQMDLAAGRSAVRWTGPMLPDWRVQPRFRGFDRALRPTMALASRHVDQRTLRSTLGQFGIVHAITPLNTHFRVVHMDLPGDAYMDLAREAAVFTLQYVQQDAGPRGEMSNQSVVGNYDGSNTVFPGYATWLSNTGYDGSGITVGVVDGRVLTTHVDLADRMAPCSGTNGSCGGSGSNAHGTHVAGAIAGTGATGALLQGFLRGQGVAPGASIVTQVYQPFLGSGPGGMVPEGMLKIYQDSAKSGALLTNNSWGPTGSPQGYDIPTMEIDFISRDADPDTAGDQPVLAVWSIMNGNGDGSGACAPSSLGSPDEAKNLFAVGSTSLQNSDGTQVANIFRVSGNSGHGNACDGRRVPHIVAPGCSTDSTTNSSDTAHSASFCGTSMASPVVSGSVSVWAEKYLDETGNNPSPALVKAVFTAAAQNLVGNPNADGVTMGHRPDRFQGYGRIDLEQVMNHGLEVYMTDQETVLTSAGEQWSLGLNAVNPAEPIRIMLAWTDAPGAGLGGTTPAWVNNLDLVVEADGSTYLGNVIGGDGWSATGGSADGMNNLEGVFLSPGQHQGAVAITVEATDLAGDGLDPWNPGSPRQDFALACYNCIVGDPTFTLGLDPEQAGMCVPDSGTDVTAIAVDVGTLGAYSGTVSLASSGEPAGVGSVLTPTSIAAPGGSSWQVTVDDSASTGEYPLTLTGDDGSDVHQVDFTLTLDEPLAAAPSQLAPADGASDLVLRPEFSWDGLTGVSDYRLQVATDAGFGTVVIDETVTGTSFTPASDLALDTEYFWRVAGNNLCGDGVWSTIFSFTTRQEPVADLSATSFSFAVNAGGSADQTLQVGNVGTGNLTWSMLTDALETAALPRDSHDPALDEPLSLAGFSLPGSGSHSDSANAGLISRGQVVGFTFEGTVSGISGTATWASDLALTITGPEGASFSVGGYQTGNPPWDFDGGGSTDDGTYTSTHIGTDIFGAEGELDEGQWQFQFDHTWNDTMNWTDVTITLHKAPLPVCDGEYTSVDWLSATPDSGSVAAGNSETVTIGVDASALGNGNYLGYLCLTTNDPAAAMVPIPVDLEVTGTLPDATLEGTVTSLGHCQNNPAALANAAVDVMGQLGGPYATTTDAGGFYTLDIPADESPVDIMVSEGGHASAAMLGVGLSAGNTEVADFDLVVLDACAQVSPAALNPALVVDTAAASELVLDNGAGGIQMSWSLDTSPGCYNPATTDWLSLTDTGGTVDAGDQNSIFAQFDASGLAPGSYTTDLCLTTNDSQQPTVTVPIMLEVRNNMIFDDRFENAN